MIPNTAVYVRCGNCAALTEHRARREFETTACTAPELERGHGRMSAATYAQILQCRCCGDICFRCGMAERSQPDVIYWTMYINPDPAHADADRLPENVGKVYRETVEAIKAGCLTLAAAGMRAVVEGVCQQNGCTGSDLQDRIRNLRANHIVSGREASALHAHRVFGNDALHHMKTPSLEEVLDALAMLDHVLETLYQLPRRTNRLLRRRDSRLQGIDVPIAERIMRANRGG
jgi:hypothetical protein